jgi:hypothetical protein
MITILPKRALKVKTLVEEVATLWENPAERLSNVASTDITLMDELNGVGTCIAYCVFLSHHPMTLLIPYWLAVCLLQMRRISAK